MLTLVALTTAACDAGGSTTDDATPSRTAAGQPSTGPSGATDDPPPVVAEVLDFEAPLLGGGTLEGESLAGRDVAFWFWAPW